MKREKGSHARETSTQSRSGADVGSRRSRGRADRWEGREDDLSDTGARRRRCPGEQQNLRPAALSGHGGPAGCDGSMAPSGTPSVAARLRLELPCPGTLKDLVTTPPRDCWGTWWLFPTTSGTAPSPSAPPLVLSAPEIFSQISRAEAGGRAFVSSPRNSLRRFWGGSLRSSPPARFSPVPHPQPPSGRDTPAARGCDSHLRSPSPSTLRASPRRG